MSEKSIPLIAAVAIIALMFAWMQILNFASPRWSRILRRLRLKRMKAKRDKGDHPYSVGFQQTITPHAGSVLPLSSRRLADRSRDLRQALSARERGVSRSDPATPHISSLAE